MVSPPNDRPFNPRANGGSTSLTEVYKSIKRGMVLRELVILQYLVRLERAPTRPQTQNPGLGMKVPNPGLVMSNNSRPALSP
jgi:hypothetical protein